MEDRAVSRIAAVSYEHFDKFGFARGKSLASVCFQELYGRLTALMSERTPMAARWKTARV